LILNRADDQEYLRSFEMCWRRMEFSWTHHMRNEQVLHRVKEKRIFYIQQKGGKLPGFVTSSTETVF